MNSPPSYALPLTILLAGLAGCQLPGGSTITPDAAVAACSGPVTLALRSRDAGLTRVELAPAAATRIETRRTAVGRQPVALLVEGAGAARKDGAARPVRYLCLLDPGGEAVFVDAATMTGDDAVLAGCAPPARDTCLADRLRAAERALAAAEAAALKRATATRRAAIEEPLATSIGAWRVYRDAECARRSEAATPGAGPDLITACSIGLTRTRTAELAG